MIKQVREAAQEVLESTGLRDVSVGLIGAAVALNREAEHKSRYAWFYGKAAVARAKIDAARADECLRQHMKAMWVVEATANGLTEADTEKAPSEGVR